MERSDQELIKGYLAGSDHDFGILFERYKNQLYGYLMKMIPESKTDVDDVFQKTWIKVMLKLPFYNTSSGHFQAWLFRIGHNLSIDFFRSRKRLKEHLSMDTLEDYMTPISKERPAAEMMNREIAFAVGTALDQLSTEQREVFLLRQQGLSFKEIASIQKCPLNTALARMQYAVKKLREILSEGGFSL